MEDVFIISAVRTPTGKYLGALSPLTATQLGAIAVREAARRSGIEPSRIDEVVMGNVLSAGLGQNPARQAALKAGLPETVAAVTLNKVCGSGLRAVIAASQAIRCGDASIAVAGGMESMSNAPYLSRKMRGGARMGHVQLEDAILTDGLWCAFDDHHMGETAELVAEEYRISREDQDRYAAESHRKAAEAQERGWWDDEVVPVDVPGRRGGATTVAVDETIRPDSTVETLAGLRPVFRKEGGTVTAGNAPGMNDGASALVLASGAAVERLGLTPLARIVAYAVGGVEPKWVMMSPVPAVQRLLEKRGITVDDFDLIEANEAFSVQAVAVCRKLGFDMDRVNVQGGAVALGHPIGASGARILTTLVHGLRRRNLTRGLATLCMGGGNGLALEVEVTTSSPSARIPGA